MKIYIILKKYNQIVNTSTDKPIHSCSTTTAIPRAEMRRKIPEVVINAR